MSFESEWSKMTEIKKKSVSWLLPHRNDVMLYIFINRVLRQFRFKTILPSIGQDEQQLNKYKRRFSNKTSPIPSHTYSNLLPIKCDHMNCDRKSIALAFGCSTHFSLLYKWQWIMKHSISIWKYVNLWGFFFARARSFV